MIKIAQDHIKSNVSVIAILKRYIHCVNLYFSIALAGYP
jgi:hypothetical protein